MWHVFKEVPVALVAIVVDERFIVTRVVWSRDVHSGGSEGSEAAEAEFRSPCHRSWLIVISDPDPIDVVAFDPLLGEANSEDQACAQPSAPE